MKYGVLKTVFILPALTAGGAERVLITLMNMLDRERFDPVFITVSESGPLREIIDPTIPFHSLGGRRVSLSLPRFYKKLKELKPDIVVTTMAHMNFATLLLKPFFPDTSFIVREAIVPSFILGEHPALSPALKGAYRFLYPRASTVISPAQAIIDEFKSLLTMECSNHVLLRNPVNTDLIRAAESKHQPMSAARGKEVHFVAAGRLHSQKGFDRLIEALPALKMPYEWKLTILGEGPERVALEKIIDELNLEDKVSLPGLSDAPWPHYAMADCFLMPSRWEGLPNVALESLACGTPVIATRESGGIAEIAALAPQGSVTVVDTIEAFIHAMEKIKPNPAEVFRASLLPKEFHKETVKAAFTDILLRAA
jgi:glycosyltransferase involved in cell wall biosynthesis